MNKLISYIGHIRSQKKLTKTQLYLAAFGILLFLSLALALPLLNSPLNKNQNTLKTYAAPPGTGWVQTFDDEFNSFDPLTWPGVWDTYYQWGPDYTINNELEYYVNTQDPNHPLPNVNPFSVTNGILTIRADKNSAPNNKQYTSGVITSFDSFNQKYGYFEMRAKLPAGKGLWPAFWMLPKNAGSPPELDIMEAVGSQPTSLYTTSHSSLTNPTDSHCYPQVADMTAGFHTFGFKWDSSTMTWYFDGTQVCQFPTQSDQNQPFYMILNLAIGSGGWTGTPDSTNVWPADYQIDYVRVWQQSNQNPAPCVGPDCTTVTPTPTPTPAATPSPVAYWKFDETSGTTASDSSGNNNPGTLINGPLWVTGRISNAVQLDGANDYVQVADNDAIDAVGDFTLALWVKSTQGMVSGQWPAIMFKDGYGGSGTRTGYGIYLHDSNSNARWFGNLIINDASYSVSGNSNIADGLWHHLVFEREGTTIRSYQDGTLANTLTAVNTSAANSFPLRFGKTNFASPYEYFFAGTIDDARFYNRSLSASDVLQLYQGTSGPTNTPTPTSTPTPTYTPTPTNTPTPTPTPGIGDTTPPTISITSPANNATVSRHSNVTITASASDNIGVTKVEFYVNNTLKTTDTTSPYSYIWSVPNSRNVQYTLTAKAYDAAGNNAISAAVNVTAK